MIDQKKIVEVVNKNIEVFNTFELTNEELLLVFSQILIYSGHSITKKKIDLNRIDWEDLHKIYYADNDENDIGLGLILNGASIMQALPANVLEDIKGNVTAKQGDLNGNQVSATTKVPQKNSSTSTGSSKTKRRSREGKNTS